jgi:hypothetical protein
MESTSNLKTNDISNLNKILSLIVAKGKINNSMVAKHLSLDRLESDFIFNTFCTYADNIDIIKAEFFNSDSAAIVRIHKPQLTRFIDNGGFTEYFKEKEDNTTKSNTFINYGQIGNAIQSSGDTIFKKPTVKQKNAPASSKAVTKSSKVRWYTNRWLIGVALVLITALFNTKRIMSLFNNIIDSF